MLEQIKELIEKHIELLHSYLAEFEAKQPTIPNICQDCQFFDFHTNHCTENTKPACEKYKPCLKCYACGILIGPCHIEIIATDVDSKKLCGVCLADLNKNGFLHLGEGKFLLADGTTSNLTEHETAQFFSTPMKTKNFKGFLAELGKKRSRKK